MRAVSLRLLRGRIGLSLPQDELAQARQQVSQLQAEIVLHKEMKDQLTADLRVRRWGDPVAVLRSSVLFLE